MSNRFQMPLTAAFFSETGRMRASLARSQGVTLERYAANALTRDIARAPLIEAAPMPSRRRARLPMSRSVAAQAVQLAA